MTYTLEVKIKVRNQYQTRIFENCIETEYQVWRCIEWDGEEQYNYTIYRNGNITETIGDIRTGVKYEWKFNPETMIIKEEN
jgi:hypothetical protein